MKEIQLTTEEKIELKERGFLIYNGVSFISFIKNIVTGSILVATFVGMLYSGIFKLFGPEFLINIQSLFSALLLFSIGIPLTISGIYYALCDKYYFTNSGIIAFGGIEKKWNRITEREKKIFIFNTWNDCINRDFMSNHGNRSGLSLVKLGKIICGSLALVYGVIYTTNFFPVGNYTDIIRNIFIFISPLIVIVSFSMILKQFIRIFHPLYIFGNLGSRIQSVTPTIESKSREIEKNFSEDMDFARLKSGFRELATSLAKVSDYIMRLEVAEKKANKGNLFDSQKYIGSLRSDILEPLRSLRGFLETKRTDLIRSQQELSQVRVQVGGTSENRDLASARTEPLIIELTGNIEKLDVMIGKMG